MTFLLLGAGCIIIGTTLLIFSLKRFGRSVYGEENSTGFRLKTSLGFGVSSFMLFLGLLLSMEVFDLSYQWTMENFFSSLEISAFLGIIITVFSFLRSIIIGGIRELTFLKLRIKSKNKSLPQNHNLKDH